MRIPRVYIDHPLEVGQRVDLPSDRAHYVANVLRLSSGRPVILFNGQGGEYRGSLVDASRKGASVELDAFDSVNRESPLDLELAIGLSRGDRMDWIIQKATELGIGRISPLVTERTEVKLKGSRLEKKMRHWQQIVVSACEQCQRNRLPLLDEPQGFPDYVARCEADTRLLLHPTTDGFHLSASREPGSVAVLVGPEGGFSEAEVENALARDFAGWQLGPRILRTETAPMAALSILQHHWGDWQ